jgi:hypothetical protein
MQIDDSQKVTERFFEALYAMKEQKIIGGKTQFARRYGINTRNFWLLEQNKSRDIFKVAWLTYLVNDYGISAKWLLTGKGNMFKKKLRKKIKKAAGKNKKDEHKADISVPSGQGKGQTGRETPDAHQVEQQ